MRKEPSIIKSFIGTIIILVVVYFTVYTLASNEEIVRTEVLKEIPIEVESVPGLEIEVANTYVDIEVKGTNEMYHKLKDAPPRVKVGVEEKEGIEVENYYEESERINELLLEERDDKEEGGEEDSEVLEDDKDEEEVEQEEEVELLNLKEYFEDVIEIEGLEGFIHDLLTDVNIDVVAVEPEEVDVKVKIRGKTEEPVTKVEVKESVKGYLNESDKENIEEINVYVDVDSIDKDGETIGTLGIVDKEGKEISIENRLNRENVRVKVYF